MRHHPTPPRGSYIRREIAALAARLMAEDGISDFGFAKRKAAKQLGVSETEALPNNAEVEAELRAWLALYQDDEQADRIRAMRETAVEVMHLLEEFRPYLTGGVLDGTAGRYSEVEIELYPESAKDVEIFLLNQDVQYEHRETRRVINHMPEVILSFEWDDVPVRLTIHEQVAERAPRRGAERARVSAIEALLQAEASGEE
ncbi:MAG: hypothetical protein LPJ91_03915 [Pseudazoarcus pumilus]|nr:hypothetical protein [Pseudazoarcus pumilus]